MALITRLFFIVIGLAIVLLSTSYTADAPKQKKGSLAKASPPEKKPVHLIVRSRAEIKQIFTYAPYPAVPSELEGYGGSQVSGTGTYRLSVDAQGAVTQVAILKGFTVTAVYDERFSDVKGNALPALDKVMVQSLMRWRAKPGPTRVVDIYWSFGTRPWVNYGKQIGFRYSPQRFSSASCMTGLGGRMRSLCCQGFLSSPLHIFTGVARLGGKLIGF